MNYDAEFLKSLIRPDQSSLKKELATQLKSLGYEPVSGDGFLYAEGEVPVLLIAHMDTVHAERAEIICFSEDMRYVMSPQGIGGDDRCGLYMILELIKEARCHVLFCEDEEPGSLGAERFTHSGIFPKVDFIVEIDRRGGNDAVFYRCDNPEFTKFVLGFGFEKKRGTSSDISVIAPYLQTAAVNISAGYYNPHCLNEYIDMTDVQNNIRRIGEMIRADHAHFAFIPMEE